MNALLLQAFPFIRPPRPLKKGLISLVILLLTFPELSTSFGPGLDDSYRWALNHLFATGHPVLFEMDFPYGPLGFLKFPLPVGNSLALGLSFHVGIRLLWIYLFLHFAERNGRSLLSASLLTLGVSYFLDLDLLFIGLTVILSTTFIQTHERYLLLAATMLSLLGLLIKVSIGIASFSVIGMALAFLFYKSRDRRAFLLNLSLVLGGIFLPGLLIFGGVMDLWDFFESRLLISASYSTEFALFPSNEWSLLGGSVLLYIALPFMMREEKGVIAWMLLLLPAFAMWKHSVVREDISHQRIFLDFLVMGGGLLIASAQRPRFRWILPLAGSILLFNGNMMGLPSYEPIRKELIGVEAFTYPCFHFEAFRKEQERKSQKELTSLRLPRAARERIGNGKLDVFPWELSYIPANDLNWAVRSPGKSLSPWLSRQRAKLYGESNDAPKYLLFHLKDDSWGGKLGSIDGRYLLNDDFPAVLSILRNYGAIARSSEFLLFERSSRKRLGEPKSFARDTLSWNEWVEVPDRGRKEILSARFFNDPAWLGMAKTFLYKGERFTVDLLLADGRKLSYRFIPSKARVGMWIAPWILHPHHDHQGEAVEQVRFRCSNPAMREKGIRLTWQRTQVLNGARKGEGSGASSGEVSSLFGKKDSSEKRLLFESRLDFEEGKLSPYWKGRASPGSKVYAHKGNGGGGVPPGTFSTTLELPFERVMADTIRGSERIVEVGLWFRNAPQKARAVIEVRGKGMKDIWKEFPLQACGRDRWSYAYGKVATDLIGKEGRIKVYVQNRGPEKLRIDDLKVRVLKGTEYEEL